MSKAKTKYYVDWLASIIGICALIGLILLAIYGMYWAGKYVSYYLFYADMVEQTVRDMVIEGSLK